MRRAEALARTDREQEYAELETELHRVWRIRPVSDEFTENLATSHAMTKADTPQPEAAAYE
jgi:hypothetical protein